MAPLPLANIADTAAALANWLYAPIAAAPWSDWRGFWLGQVFDDRFVVVWFLPLLPILMLLRGDRLRIGIIVTGLVFIAYICGIPYVCFWLASCLLLHALSERFAYECRRKDVWQLGPPLAMIAIIGGWYVGTMFLHHVKSPPGNDAWLYEHARWLFPLGTRGWPWEPHFRLLYAAPAAAQPPALLAAMFWNVHNIGTAYLTVRMLHYFSEIKRGTLPAERRTRLNFLAYTCYGPGWMQGPLERFEPFQAEMDTCHTRRSWRNVPPALARMALGVSKSLVGTLYLIPLLRDELGLGRGEIYHKHPEQIASTWLLYLGVAFELLWLYIEFSGYCDVSAGMARLLGYRQVENFDRPYLATSLRDLWRRWHLSLSFILRDYVYIPLGGNRRHVVLNLVLTFVVCGVWHELGARAATWGVLMALFVAVDHYWVAWLKRLDTRPAAWPAHVRRTWLRLQPLPRLCGWAITQNAFLFTLLALFGGSAVYRVPLEIARRLWAWLAT